MTPGTRVSRPAGAAVLAAAAAAVAAGLALAPPIPQDEAYHRFADDRTVLGVPRFWDVVSNAPFLFVGALGLAFVLSRRAAPAFLAPADRVPWGVFFAGVLATAAGSAWYHLDPTTPRLFWDRLPMAVGFSGLAAAALGERIHPRAALALTAPFVALGLSSVLHWRATEAAGAGDLRAYAAVQYGPLVLLPLAFWLFPTPRAPAAPFFVALGWYALAKAFEALDRPVYDAVGVVSGHTLKHLAAAGGALAILRMLRRRGARAAAGAAP